MRGLPGCFCKGLLCQFHSRQEAPVVSFQPSCRARLGSASEDDCHHSRLGSASEDGCHARLGSASRNKWGGLRNQLFSLSVGNLVPTFI